MYVWEQVVPILDCPWASKTSSGNHRLSTPLQADSLLVVLPGRRRRRRRRRLTLRSLKSPVGEASNSSGRPPPPPPRRATPPSRAPHRPARFVSEELWSSSSAISSSDREDTPWPDTEDLSDFVDLTADSSPPNMPPANSQRRQPPSRMSRNTSSAPSNPAKRRKTEASQSSNRAHKIEEVDLRVSTTRGCNPCSGSTNGTFPPRFVISGLQLAFEHKNSLKREGLTSSQDVDDDAGLSKVLEQQRMATIKAQQEQANKPVKLSTLQCIICMETMKDLTATHCGTSFFGQSLVHN